MRQAPFLLNSVGEAEYEEMGTCAYSRSVASADHDAEIDIELGGDDTPQEQEEQNDALLREFAAEQEWPAWVFASDDDADVLIAVGQLEEC